jgi:hypothetical protein
MQNTVVVKGRLTGPTSVELDQPVDDTTPSEVEVVIRPAPAGGAKMSVSEFLRKLPRGTRSKEDIDRQIREERESWGDR